MVHNSKALLKSLESFICMNVTLKKSCWSLSTVKQDGTVFVRFRSDQHVDAEYLTGCFCQSLTRACILSFVQTDDNKVRVSLDGFEAAYSAARKRSDVV